MATLRWGSVSDPGRIRQQNEDTVLVDSTMFAVADGMGGHKAGEVASALTVQLLKRRLDASSSLDDVLAAVVEANGEIHEAATSNVDHQGMGTTLTGLFVVHPPAPAKDSTDGDKPAAPPPPPSTESFALINIGDSRTYLLRHGRLRRITVDHNYVQELVNAGQITDDEARNHPRRNIITRALGIDPTVRVDAWTVPSRLLRRALRRGSRQRDPADPDDRGRGAARRRGARRRGEPSRWARQRVGDRRRRRRRCRSAAA
jgi:protein phosphatase